MNHLFIDITGLVAFWMGFGGIWGDYVGSLTFLGNSGESRRGPPWGVAAVGGQKGGVGKFYEK